MVTTYSASVCVEANAYLCSTSNNHNSFDGIFSMRSINIDLEVVTNFQDDVSCGQDVMLECNCIFTTYAMLQSVVVS